MTKISETKTLCSKLLSYLIIKWSLSWILKQYKKYLQFQNFYSIYNTTEKYINSYEIQIYSFLLLKVLISCTLN